MLVLVGDKFTSGVFCVHESRVARDRLMRQPALTCRGFLAGAARWPTKNDGEASVEQVDNTSSIKASVEQVDNASSIKYTYIL